MLFDLPNGRREWAGLFLYGTGSREYHQAGIRIDQRSSRTAPNTKSKRHPLTSPCGGRCRARVERALRRKGVLASNEPAMNIPLQSGGATLTRRLPASSTPATPRLRRAHVHPLGRRSFSEDGHKGGSEGYQ